jgi:hypothetical protein
VNAELERMWKEAVIAKSGIISRNLSAVTEKYQENLRKACLWVEISTKVLLDIKQGS